MEIEASSSSSIEKEVTEFDPNPLQQYSDVAESVESVQPRKRGRPSIPDQWSQVLSLDGGRELRLKSYLISTDTLYVKGIPPVPTTRREKQWEPIFFSKTFVKNDLEITLEKYKISESKLKSIGVQATRLRQQIQKDVERDQINQSIEQDQNIEEVKKLSTILKRRLTSKELLEKRLQRPDYVEHVPPGSRRQSWKHQPLSTEEKIGIVHKALVGKEPYGPIAREHRVSQNTISQLVSKAKKKKEFYSELLSLQT